MTSSKKIILPKLGESIVSATVVRWFKNIGDTVDLDESLLEVATDKVNSEIPSPYAGVLQEILAHPGQEVDVGAPLALIGTGTVAQLEPIDEIGSDDEPFLSPSVQRLLRENRLTPDDVKQIPHTGLGGRLTQKDVRAYLDKKGKCPASVPPVTGAEERMQMTPMRKAIAENMVRSFYEAPHASLMTEVDVTTIVHHIQQEKEAFFDKHKAKLSITPFVAEAIAFAAREFPLINASLDGDTIVMKKQVHLGIAVSVDHGVMVPVIRGAGSMTIAELAQAISRVAEKARGHQLSPDDVAGGTITMTNFGMAKTMIGVPIIRHPEVAIVGIGAITRKVVPLADDSIAIRSIMWVTLTFDHRVLDGLYGCGFLSALRERLESNR